MELADGDKPRPPWMIQPLGGGSAPEVPTPQPLLMPKPVHVNEPVFLV